MGNKWATIVMKKIYCLLMLILFINSANAQYVDLGLPSRTLWKESNEEGFYTHRDAVSEFGATLPTKEQYMELIDVCKWKWQDGGFIVVGPNRNSIFFPAKGAYNSGGYIDTVYGYSGYYWTVAVNNLKMGWYIKFIESAKPVIMNGGLDTDNSDFFCPVRLVKLNTNL